MRFRQGRLGLISTVSAVVALVATGAIAVSAAGAADSGHDTGNLVKGAVTHALTRQSSAAASSTSTTARKSAAAPTSTSSTSSVPRRQAAAGSSSASSSKAPAAQSSSTASAQTSSRPPFMATLATHANTAAKESEAGLKVAMLEVQWSRFEPKRGQINRNYAIGVQAQFNKLRNAGMQVTLSPGLHFTPSWVLATKSNHMIDNHGHYSKQADFVFNAAVRARANHYLHELDHWIDLRRVWAMRVTSGGTSELLYPSSSFWAYSPGAQSAQNRPKNVAANPRPGWRPGDKSTVAQRNAWAHWYIGALSSEADWQMSTAKGLGFHGYFQTVTPGQGVRPQQWNGQMASGLQEGMLGRGAAWYVLYRQLRERTNVVAYLSSLADGTADDDLCQSSDAKMPYKGTNFFRWSGARWLAWVAHYNGFKIAGESPGYPATSAGRAHYTDRSSHGLLATAERQAKSCGFQGVYWAHDDQVWDGTMPLSALAGYTTPSAVEPANAPA